MRTTSIRDYTFTSYLLPIPARNIIFRAFFFWSREKCFAFAIFHEFPLQEEGGIIGSTACLLYRVRHKNDRVFLLELLQGSFHFARRDGVKPGGWLIEQDD